MNDRWINWRFENRAGKETKVPFDPSTGKRIDPLDPANWKSEADARATGERVGEVLTADDPFAVIDIDDCYNPATGEWDDRARRVFGMLNGDPVWKLSTSGAGVHIKIRVDKSETAKLRKRIEGIEIYSQDRFIAMGDMGWQPGDLETDRTDVVRAIMPPAEGMPTGAVPVEGGRDPMWRGPEDDDELLQRALNSKPGLGQQFDGKATFADLWNANEPVLARNYPDSDAGRAWDQSAADSALMTQLAFWTGRDQERMTRLYLRSPLATFQSKTARPDYVSRSIAGAAKTVSKVYRDPRMSENQPGGLPSEFWNVPDTVAFLEQFTYIADRHMVLNNDGRLLKPDVFDSLYGGPMFAMSWDNGRPTDSAFKALTRNRAHRFPKAMTTRFEPGEPFGEIKNEAVNVYVPHVPFAKQGDVSPWMFWFERCFPSPIDRDILLAYMAAVVQHQGSKFLWAPVIQGTKGNGKSMIGVILTYCIGDRYTFPVNPKKIDAQFNQFLEHRLLLTVEEIHMNHKRSALDSLKPLISERFIAMEAKRADEKPVENKANWIFTTNYKNAVIKERDDRRLAVFFSGQQSRDDIIRAGMGGDFFVDLWNWLRNEGFAHMAHFLQHYEIPAELNPAVDRGGKAKWAPETSSTGAAVMASYGSFQQEVIERVDQGDQGFRGGWISSVKLDEMVRDLRLPVNRHMRSEMLEQLGYRMVCRSSRHIPQEGGSRPVLWALEAVPGDERNVDGYMRAQGYVAGGAAAPVIQMPRPKGV